MVEKTTAQVFTSHVVSPREFFVQLATAETELERLAGFTKIYDYWPDCDDYYLDNVKEVKKFFTISLVDPSSFI